MTSVMMVKTHWFWGNTWWPPTLTIGENEVVLERKRFLGFLPERNAIPYARVAAVNVSKGMFTSSLTLETTGGGKHQIKAVPNCEAEGAVEQIRARISRRQSLP